MISRHFLISAAIAAISLSSCSAFQTTSTAGSPSVIGRALKGSLPRASSVQSTSLYAATKKAAAPKAKRKTAVKKTAAKAKDKDAEEVVNFKKAEFVAGVAQRTGMTKAESESALAAVLDVITTEVASGKRISLPGFGTFKLNYRKARKGRNPKTGEEIDIKASFSPSFSASKVFKELANPNR